MQVTDKRLFVRRLREDFHANRVATEFLDSLLHTSGDLFDRRGPAERLDVAFEQLGSRGQFSRKFLRLRIHSARAGLRFSLNNWSTDGISRASMTGVAGQFAMPFEAVFVERDHHSHHGARRLFGFLVVLLEMAFDVTETAFHPE